MDETTGVVLRDVADKAKTVVKWIVIAWVSLALAYGVVHEGWGGFGDNNDPDMQQY